ncbi:MAG: hypothetical protein JWO92_2512 [Chitinophagaceae bacterium]|nr:hypothetical protein [Chitinophagaceae bacterium]
MTTLNPSYELLTNVTSYIKEKGEPVVIAKKGTRVTLISMNDPVAIVEDLKGERFSTQIENLKEWHK